MRTGGRIQLSTPEHADGPAPVKNLRTLCLMSLMLLSAAAVFAVSGDAPQTFAIAAAGLLGSFMLRRPLARTQRSFIYAGLIAVIVTVLSDQIMPVNPRRFFLMPAEVYCPAVILIGVAATYFDQRESNVTAVVALSLVATMMAGNVVGFPDENERLLVLGPYLVEHFHAFYAGAVVFQLSAMLMLLPRAPGTARQRRAGARYTAWRRAVLAVAVALVVGGVLTVRSVAFRYERRFQNVFADWFQRYLYRRGSRIVFGEEVDLWRTVPLQQRGQQAVVLRAQAERPPGYLRGRVFLTYRNGRWSDCGNGRTLPSQLPDERLSFQVYERSLSLVPATRAGGPPDEDYVGIYPAPQFRSNVLLAPGNTRLIEIVAESLSNNPDGVMVPADWEERIGYFVHLQQPFPDHAYQGPAITGDNRAAYLQTPTDIAGDLATLAEAVFGSGSPQGGTTANIARLMAFFDSDFQYELGVHMRSMRLDPVLQFLNNTRRGHCELFATAAVLLLRSRGIPARYVTGFVCAEPNPSGDYWLARLADAHAWAEAYVEEIGGWVTVEATPAAAVPGADSEMGLLASPFDRLSLSWQQVWSLMKRGYVARGIVATAVFFVRGLMRTATHPIGAPLLLLVLWFVLRRLRRRFSSTTDNGSDLLSATRADLSESYLHLVRTLRRLGLDCPANATPREIMAQVRTHPVLDSETGISAIIDTYLPLRFRSEPPAKGDVDALKKRIDTALRQARKRRLQPGDTPRRRVAEAPDPHPPAD